MNLSEAKRILHYPYLPAVLVSLSHVNLTDRELEVLILRHIRGHTQETVAEHFDMSVNGLQNVEKTALTKCASAWDNLIYAKELLKATP